MHFAGHALASAVFVATLAQLGCLAPAAPADPSEWDQLTPADKALADEAAIWSVPGGILDDTLPTSTTLVGAEALQAMVDRVRAAQFPALNGLRIEARLGDSETALLRTAFGPLDLVRPRAKRRYQVIISSAFATTPDAHAIEALVVHELQHIYDYAQLSGTGLLEFVTTYVLSPHGFVPAYERDTDLRALERAADTGRATQAADMVRYREFLYEVLPPADVAVKRRDYLQPTEILDCDAQIQAATSRQAPCLIQTAVSSR